MTYKVTKSKSAYKTKKKVAPKPRTGSYKL